MCSFHNMKAIQISFDEKLLEELDATEEARTHGRSAVFRKAVAEYLQRRRGRAVAERYARAYGGARRGLGRDFEGWEDQGQRPDE